jgi:molybdate transport system substrate-binding protein
MKKKKSLLLIMLCVVFVLATGCQKKETATTEDNVQTSVEATADTTATTETTTEEATVAEAATNETATTDDAPVEILVAAAASLQNSLEDIQKLYQKEYPNVTITYTFGSSGTLQEQIEQGAPADVFMSAALKQMTALEDGGFILDGTKKELLENKVVLIVPADSTLGLTKFEDIVKAPVIAIGDPDSVPAGQYAEQVFTSLGIQDAVDKVATKGKDVTEVLTWVSSGNADAGVVYATDAQSSKDVKVVAQAPEGSCDKVIYPAAVVKASKAADAAKAFVDYLASDEAMSVFESYGFSKNAQ